MPVRSPEDIITGMADFDLSGGVILDLLLHDIDYLCWTFGKVKRVYAKGMRYADKPGKDYALVTIRFESGEIAHLEGSWCEPPGTFYTTIEMACADGMLEYDRRKIRPLVYTPIKTEKGSVPPVVIPEMPELESPYLKELHDVIEAVKNGGSPPIPVSEALPAIEVVDGAFTSIRTGQPVVLDGKGGAA